MKRALTRIGLLLLAGLLGPLMVYSAGATNNDWQRASRAPAGLAPDPAATPEAVVQVYAARTFGWRGAFGVHCWIAVKPADAAAYTVYEVVGWNVYRGGNAVVARNGAADSRWFGNLPRVLAELRGDAAAAAIPRIEQAVASYPYPGEYRVWPGPNSNTFVAYVARAVPELRLDLPPTAIGKDYLDNGKIADAAPSGTGYQVSLFGLLGMMVAVEEGVEINFLGLTFGIDPLGLALKLPGLGRVGAE